ncbi:IS5 family transposase [Marinobacterium stanieri]|uniref:Transposase, IS5 family n=1 Tax=Marinobacterium stanieri TaxID=49186 RepID=A0A1N6X9M8_9GAMM|nr:IS5 family transposase [Marinobacterium stanieri]SIQ99036.1 transposase, IS5 family [Marinobacterium stanieri]
MDQQLTFADSEFSNKRRQTRKEKFLGRMDKLIPWPRLENVIEPHYPKPGNGLRPYPLSTMLRIHCMQQWYNLSDPAMEDALYEIASMRLFAGLSLDKAIQNHSTILKFRHLLEQHGLARQIFDEVNKNRSSERDPEMHQTKKGNQWHFGLKAHIGVDARTGITHSFTTTAANEHDLNQAEHLLHGDEAFILADAGYRGAEKREELKDVSADWHIVEQPGQLETLKKHPRINKVRIRTEYLKVSLRAKVEHPFRIIKCQFGFVKARYRGLKKNDGKLAMLFALSNLVRVDQMLRAQG